MWLSSWAMNWAFFIGHKTCISLIVFSCRMGSLLPTISYESGSLELVNSININVVHISIQHHSDCWPVSSWTSPDPSSPWHSASSSAFSFSIQHKHQHSASVFSITVTVYQFLPELLPVLPRLGIALELWLCLSSASLSSHLLPVTIHSLPSA